MRMILWSIRVDFNPYSPLLAHSLEILTVLGGSTDSDWPIATRQGVAVMHVRAFSAL